jgi:hypothetical protein
MARLGLVQMTITTSAGDFEMLQAAASSRGVSTTSLAASLLHVTVSQRLVDAVLDDGRD